MHGQPASAAQAGGRNPMSRFLRPSSGQSHHSPPAPLAPSAAPVPSDGSLPPPPGSAAPSTLETGVSQSIQILEACRWRIILEHGLFGEVVAVAAFAPGPGGESTPNTPATPMAGATPGGGGLGDWHDQRGRSGFPPRSAGGNSAYNNSNSCNNNISSAYGANSAFAYGGAPDAASSSSQAGAPPGSSMHGPNLWINTNEPSHRAMPPMPLRFAWDPTDPQRPPLTPPPRRTALPLRRGAPAALWGLLHAFGLRELDVHTACNFCDLVALGSSALMMAVLVSQVGVLLVHWADALPLPIAVGLFVGIFSGWYFKGDRIVGLLQASSRKLACSHPACSSKLACHPACLPCYCTR